MVIKFRGRRIDNGEYVYGRPSYMQLPNAGVGDCIIPCDDCQNGIAYTDKGKVKTVPVKNFDQWTGLLDKNGREIYENDFISCRSREKDLLIEGYVDYGKHWRHSEEYPYEKQGYVGFYLYARNIISDGVLLGCEQFSLLEMVTDFDTEVIKGNENVVPSEQELEKFRQLLMKNNPIPNWWKKIVQDLEEGKIKLSSTTNGFAGGTSK